MKNVFAFLNQRLQVFLLLAAGLMLSEGCEPSDCVGNQAAFQSFRVIGGFGCNCNNYEGSVDPIGPLNNAQLGEQVLFCATNAASGVSFDWNFGDGIAGTGDEICHLYANAMNFTVSLSANSSTSSCQSSKSVPVTAPSALKSGPTTTTLSGGSILNTNAGDQTQGAAIPISVNDADADYGNGNLYLGGSIYRCKLDGSQLELLVDEEGLIDLYFEPQNGELYWIQETASGFNFKVANADGKNIRTLFTLPASEPAPQELVVDRKAGKVYWRAMDGNTPRIFKTGIMALDPEQIFSWNPPAVFSGLALDADAGELFFCLGVSGKWDVMRYDLFANMGGVWIESASSGAISTMQLSNPEGKIYWTARLQGDSYTLFRANRDGTGAVEDLGIPVDNPRVLTVGVVP